MSDKTDKTPAADAAVKPEAVASTAAAPGDDYVASPDETRPQARCLKTGHLLDEFGLPVAALPRAAALKGKSDPALTKEI